MARTKIRVWNCGPGKRWRCWLKRSVLLCLACSLVPVLLFRWIPVPFSAVMVQRAVQQQAWPEYRWVPLREIAPAAALAVVAAEDQGFPNHFGFDLEAIRSAAEHNARGGQMRGASTITQQVAKNLFLWEGRSWLRKGLEAWFSLLLEALWSKTRILEVYLNIAEMGPGIFGIEAASRHFFRRPAAEISPSQAATLAAALPNPLRYRADAPGGYLVNRRQWVLRQMSQLGGTAYLDGVLAHGSR